jgi:membrane protein required for colicin V production
MNVLDIILVVPIIWLMYRGYQKGFIIELSSLVALILGIYLAINFSGYASDFLTRNFNISDKYLNILAFVVTFMVVVFGVFMIGKILEQFINILLLGFINKIAGAAFGVIKAAFLISVVLWIINSFDISRTVIKDSSREGSMLYEPIEQFAPSIIPKLSLDKLKSFEVKVKDEFNATKI